MNNKFTLNDFSSFDKMIAPSFLTILYYIQMGVCILASFWFIFKGMEINRGGGMLIMAGLANLVFAPLLTRLLFEFIIVIYKIHSRLVNIDLNTSDKNSVQSSAVKQAVNEVVNIPETAPIKTQKPDNQTTNQQKEPEVRQDFWNSGNGEPQFTKPDLSSVSFGNIGNLGTNSTAPFNYTSNKMEGLDLKDISQKVPNWKLTLASFIVLVGIVSSYADAAGVGFRIIDTAFGSFALLATVAMVIISAMSLKWMWFVGSYAVTLVGTILSFLDDRSLFSLSRKMSAVADGIGGLFPQGNNYFEQARQNAPSITSYLSFSFYLMILAMVYCGYCIINGQYKERISSPQNN